MAQKEEGVGREQSRRADEAIREARKLREELNVLKQTRNVGMKKNKCLAAHHPVDHTQILTLNFHGFVYHKITIVYCISYVTEKI